MVEELGVQKDIGSLRDMRLIIDEVDLYATDCQVVTVNRTFDAKLRISSRFIVATEIAGPATNPSKLKHKRWPVHEISKIYFRTFVLRNTAMEIFLLDTSVFLNFPLGNRAK
jgi:hypothetical protein